MIERVAGMINALPMPMKARVAMSWFADPASADSTDPVPKIISPTCNAGRRPNLSPRLPIVRSKPANTSV